MKVKCPHCQHEFEEYPDGIDAYVVYEDSEQRSIKCPYCSREFFTHNDFDNPDYSENEEDDEIIYGIRGGTTK